PLDVGFIVYNERTYPGFTRLLSELDVETRPSEMSFSVRFEEDGYEFSSRGPRGYFAQWRNLLSLNHWLLLAEVVRFQRDARRALNRQEFMGVSFAQYLNQRGFSRRFRERLILPLLASTWSNAPSHILGFPAHYLFTFLETHGVLAPDSIPEWRWIEGGARTYVDRITAVLPCGSVHTGTPVRSIRRVEEGVSLGTGDGDEQPFDAVVLACHADQALALLADPDDEECSALSGLRYEPTRVVLHTDSRLLPRREAARAAWNYHARDRQSVESNRLTMTYDLNRLQGFRFDSDREGTQFCVSTNPDELLDSAKILADFEYAHPVYSGATLAAQEQIRRINGRRATYYAGAYLGYGFHEDGLQSGVEVARLLGVTW
ncbi:MAG: FAD-dependent oxidoreductase, partial [Dehalococcoidia bacterium]